MTAIELLEKFCKKGCKAEGHCDWPLCNVTLARTLLAERCEWKFDLHHGMWDTGCGNAYCTTEGDTLKQHGIKGCPFCIRPIKEIKE